MADWGVFSEFSGGIVRFFGFPQAARPMNVLKKRRNSRLKFKEIIHERAARRRLYPKGSAGPPGLGFIGAVLPVPVWMLLGERTWTEHARGCSAGIRAGNA
jgi:hypothetical protein